MCVSGPSLLVDSGRYVWAILPIKINVLFLLEKTDGGGGGRAKT